MNQGISALHGAHQVAQKFSKTTLPRYSESVTGLPASSLSLKSGAILRSSGFTYATLGTALDTFPRKWAIQLDWLRHAETQRWANARVTGVAMREMQVAIAAAATQAHLRLPPTRSRFCRRRVRPRC